MPEIYGIFALGHTVHLEANRISKKATEQRGLDLIQSAANWAGREYRKHPERFTTPTGFKEGLDYTYCTCARLKFTLLNVHGGDAHPVLMHKSVDDFEVRRFNFHRSWAGEEVRKVASCLLGRRVAIVAPKIISNYDIPLLTLFVSEELDGNSTFRVRIPAIRFVRSSEFTIVVTVPL